MPASIPVDTIDDDDGFDWEAAVREIDVACQATYPVESSSLQDTTSTALNINSFDQYNKKKPGTSRQSTLDKFVGRVFSGPLSEGIRSLRDNDLDNSDSRVCCIDIDVEAAKTWIYPVNVPLRDYQFSITKTALFSNTLVAVPTGLGKTLIAAVVMYNFFRWFPEGKIVFAAPSRPLVMQQIEACHNIVGIPLEWTIDMTGQTSPTKRACLWKSKRVFFVTPQVLEKDIQSGTCTVKNLVCLVIDEAHRALGNYSYSVAVRELMAIPVQLRILALTATPGSKQQTIQHVIDNLHISKLEYRNESDPDVSSYVHNRKLELIEVPMGQDAAEINNLLSEVIRPFVARLSAIGVLQCRDFQTLSPCELLTSREKFRQAPPPDLPHMKHVEVEGYYGVLITLYHIRKLLSSHGIRPAYDMLEEKYLQGSFARLMSRNEVIHKAKDLMKKSVLHGAPSPKLSKLTEVLIDHFETNNPQSSRVIIFSNFRGSVRDIMNALGNIGEYVKATEFIGQSSGKTLRGQSQKVQQAVLEKFRAGGFNVIVATSIGEEGLDIMEVDLVICFDANISPLRMIQRMGRTGRKHDGRVVVLACEGSELKGYMRKKANSRAIGKHMQNGGMNSFRFHSSPRMIPHVFKPEVQFVELSIEQFVRRGRKATDDHLNQTLTFADKLTNAETELITKYFHPNDENRWRLSLIAFPQFQAFSSRVHLVMHSFRTGILIDAMQHLQEMSLSKDSRTLIQDEALSGQCIGIDTIEQHASEQPKDLSEGNMDSHVLEISPKHQSKRNILDCEVSLMENSQNKDTQYIPGLKGQNPLAHSYLFGSDFVAVDALGKVLIISVPFLPLKECSNFKYVSTSSSMLLDCKKEYSHSKVLTGDYKALTLKAKDVDLTVGSQTRCTKSTNVLISRLCNSDGQQGILLDGVERILHTPNLKINRLNEGGSHDWMPNVLENKSSTTLVNDLSNDFRDTELSPRLTNLIKSGVVPESPLGDGGLSDCKGKDEFLVPDVVSPAKLQTELLEKPLSPRKIELASVDHIFHGKGVSASPIIIDIRSPLVKMNSLTGRACGSAFLICEEIQSPLANLTNNSNSKDWTLNSEDEPESVEQRCKFRRLRKFGNSCKRSTQGMNNNSIVPRENISRSFANSSSMPKKHCRGTRKPVDDVRDFIEDEAEVSSDSEACESDGEEHEEDDSFDDSFIDDRLNPTATSTQAEPRIDMMAIYRRSLLSQSPMERQPNCSTNITPDSVAGISCLSGSGSSSGKTECLINTPQIASEHQSAGRNSALNQMNTDVILSKSMPCKSSLCPKEREITENRKRKLSFHQLESVPAVNLNEKFSFQLECAVKESSMRCESEKTEPSGGDVLYDDHFYEGLDLDAVEAQATILLRYKSELSMQKQEKPPPDPTGSPSFDLGI